MWQKWWASEGSIYTVTTAAQDAPDVHHQDRANVLESQTKAVRECLCREPPCPEEKYNELERAFACRAEKLAGISLHNFLATHTRLQCRRKVACCTKGEGKCHPENLQRETYPPEIILLVVTFSLVRIFSVLDPISEAIRERMFLPPRGDGGLVMCILLFNRVSFTVICFAPLA